VIIPPPTAITTSARVRPNVANVREMFSTERSDFDSSPGVNSMIS